MVFYSVIPCNFVDRYQHFGGTCCHHLVYMDIREPRHHMSEDHSFLNYSSCENTSKNIMYRHEGSAVIYICDVNAELNMHSEFSSAFQLLPQHHVLNYFNVPRASNDSGNYMYHLP